eukprot:CAMPEP_0205820640 /NCGR_PEP_ID=MMETSP0206-20130828/3306_1 /ASSEMBLY_ACC=CAM_ASM_000279 /TAXON_ID=36767 /ORGANISM="Euplotes focardii, Strain TN1" /LENGTH=405 /DNA_ID=CAMNT_0053115559 /DNA_START=32 /DNA_END=1249 /DNA_ORIENTATION=-
MTLLACVNARSMEATVQLVQGEYIVVLQKHQKTDLSALRRKFVQHNLTESNVKYTYNINEGEFQAYHMQSITDEQAAKLKSLDGVRYVEPHAIGQIAEQAKDNCHTDSKFITWGISRSSHEGGHMPADKPYQYNKEACGQGVGVYILDTGIQETHTDFAGRASWGADYSGEGETDFHGHGTHVASTAGGEVYGVSRCSDLVSVKVCTRNGMCAVSAVLRGIEHVANAAQEAARSKSGKKVVGNMSLQFGRNQAMHDAIEALTNAGALMVTAAGNFNSDGCRTSPGAAPHSWSVGATTDNDARSGFSNWGTCTNIFAPGSNIEAAWRSDSSDDLTRSVSGTSMAAPHAAGLAANHWSNNRDMQPLQVARSLESFGNKDVLDQSSLGRGSPNLLAFMDCETPTSSQS